MQTQGLTVKESKPKKSRPKEAKPVNGKFFAPLYSNEAVKPNCQEKKKSIGRKNKIKKILFQPLETTPLKVMVRRKKATESAIII